MSPVDETPASSDTAPAEASLAAFLEHSFDVVLVVGPEGRVRYVSPSVRRILGYEPEELMDGDSFAFVHPDDVATCFDALARSVATPDGSSWVTCRVRRKDGVWRWVEVVSNNGLADPNVNGIVANLHDITELRVAERRAAAESRRFRAAFDRAPIGIALVNLRLGAAGRVERVNAALAHMLGYHPAEVEGRTLREFSHPDSLDADRAALASFTSGEADEHRIQKRYRCRDGQWLWAEVFASVVRDDESLPDYAVVQIVDVTARFAAEKMLTQLAYHDPLTGLANRRLFLERLEQALARSARTGVQHALLCLDLDRFKVVNDSLGHGVGDEILVEMANRLREECRRADTIGRVGGDEFVVLLEELEHLEVATTVAERLVAAVQRPVTLSMGTAVTISTSVGIRIAGAGDTGSAVLRDADAALYRAKDLGRSRAEVFTPDMRVRALARVAAERDLREALVADRLAVHYQPIIDLRTERPAADEALLRYSQPTATGDDRIVLPGAFMDVAEETGLITSLGGWAMREACRHTRQRQVAEGNDGLRIAVNVSPRQLLEDAFPDQVARILEQTGLAPASLDLEITEVSLVDSFGAGRGALDRLHELGCRIGIDDFGTGYSAMAYLRRLPVHFLKIDRAFVSRLSGGARDQAIVRAILALADGLGLDVVAEGVETEEQDAILRSLGCPLAQGFLYGRPRPPA